MSRQVAAWPLHYGEATQERGSPPFNPSPAPRDTDLRGAISFTEYTLHHHCENRPSRINHLR
jgi:hypothetical protein